MAAFESVPARAAGIPRAAASESIGRRIILNDGFYSVDGLKISQSYYERLWSQGRPAPFIQAKEILNNAPKISPDPRGAAGYFKYEAVGLEMGGFNLQVQHPQG